MPGAARTKTKAVTKKNRLSKDKELFGILAFDILAFRAAMRKTNSIIVAADSKSIEKSEIFHEITGLFVLTLAKGKC
jgi:hypothetical protein